MEGAEGVGGVASKLDRPVFSVYPEGVKAIWQLQEGLPSKLPCTPEGAGEGREEP